MTIYERKSGQEILLISNKAWLNFANWPFLQLQVQKLIGAQTKVNLNIPQ